MAEDWRKNRRKLCRIRQRTGEGRGRKRSEAGGEQAKDRRMNVRVSACFVFFGSGRTILIQRKSVRKALEKAVGKCIRKIIRKSCRRMYKKKH